MTLVVLHKLKLLMFRNKLINNINNLITRKMQIYVEQLRKRNMLFGALL